MSKLLAALLTAVFALTTLSPVYAAQNDEPTKTMKKGEGKKKEGKKKKGEGKKTEGKKKGADKGKEK